MSTAARKARKRAGIKFEKPAKVGTPVAQRRHVVEREWAKIGGLFKLGLMSRREYAKAGAAIDRGKAWQRAVPRVTRNMRRAGSGGGR